MSNREFPQRKLGILGSVGMGRSDASHMRKVVMRAKRMDSCHMGKDVPTAWCKNNLNCRVLGHEHA